MAILISEETGQQTKLSKTKRDVMYWQKESIHQEDIEILSAYAPNNSAVILYIYEAKIGKTERRNRQIQNCN